MIGELLRDKLVPDHALAMSRLITDTIEKIELSRADATRYLQRKEFQVNSIAKGWHPVVFEGFNLGWVNILPNRINNYYPMELRILKDFNPG
jgi:NOL1/NOP2/fmu family ribosome biogenesis protein